MRGWVRTFALVATIALIAAACGGDETEEPGASPTPAQDLQKGGTLRIGITGDVFTGYDPQKEYYQVSFSFFRCCLLRTLLSYNGQDAEHQGTQLFPDLATEEPEISADGLTWTFHMKQGLHYAPPVEDVEITAPDIVRALERTATPSVAAGYPFYYSVIEGFDDFGAGDADSISGLETPDDYTLVVHVTEPTGHLNYMFAMPTTAPIPPNPDDPDARFGVAEGHDDDYGRFTVASGPYMWEGSEDLDFSISADDQEPVAGYQPNKLWSLVRNPSWTEDGDDLRPAYVDAIQVQVTPGAEPEVLDKKVQNDELDTVFQNGIPPTIYQAFTSDPELQNRIFTNPSPGNYYISMNLGIPPFDDLALRKAVQYAINRSGIVRLSGGEAQGTVATHFTPDTLLTTSDGTALLADYDPYPTPNSEGADTEEGLQAAKDQMAQSKYDTNQDGICDAPECKDVLALGDNSDTNSAINQLVAQNLEAIGITLDLKELEGSTAYGRLIDPKNHIGLQITIAGWLMDWPDAYTFFWFPIYGPNILSQGNTNYSMIGATPEQMQEYGYELTDVPSINSQIEQCVALTGDERVQCWAEVDKALMEDVASIVPYTFSNTTNVISTLVQNYTFGAFDSQMAYDQVALAPGSE